mgnify:CR=1 FL=1
MEDLNTIRTLVTLGGVFASIVGVWFLMKYQIGELIKADVSQEQAVKAMGEKLDVARNDLSLLAQKQSVIGGMMSPDAVADHVRAMTIMEKDIERLMDAARKAGVF